MSGSFADVDLYRRWMELGVEHGLWPVLDGAWVYPVGALLPMLAPTVVGVSGEAPYAEAWCVMVTLLDAVAVALLLRRPSGRVAAVWWLLFTALLGSPVMGRLDAVVAPLTVVALLLALRHPAASTALTTVAAWIKVAPGAVGPVLLLTARRPWRDVVAPGLAVCVLVVGATAALGDEGNVLSFVQQQGGRGLQVESVAATPWVVAGVWSDAISRPFNLALVTYEIVGPGTHVAADALGAVLPLAVLGATALLWWQRRRAGERFWADDATRSHLLLRGALVVTLLLIVTNKVGSPQFISWLGPPVAVALAVRAPRWGRSAIALLGVAAATQGVYPWLYGRILDGEPLGTTVLVVRNVALVVLLAVAVRHLVVPPPATSAAGEGPAADASGTVRGQPGEQVRTGAAVVDGGVG